MVTTDPRLQREPAQQQVRGLPVWYFVLAGPLVVLLFMARLVIELVLTRATDIAAPLHTYAHLIIGLERQR